MNILKTAAWMCFAWSILLGVYWVMTPGTQTTASVISGALMGFAAVVLAND